MWVHHTPGVPVDATNVQLPPPHFAASASYDLDLPPTPPAKSSPSSRSKTTPTQSEPRQTSPQFRRTQAPYDNAGPDEENTPPRRPRRRSQRRSRDRYGYIDLKDAATSILHDPFYNDEHKHENEHEHEHEHEYDHDHDLDSEDQDDFYVQYHLPKRPPKGADAALRPPAVRHGRDEPHKVWPPPRKESLNVKTLTPWFEITARHPTMDSINIAVIGADGVGKSAFIQRALRLSRMPNTNITSVPHDVDGIPHVIVLVELDIEVFDDVDPAQPVHWPKQVDGHMVPRMDGALILYDVTNKESIRDLPPTMSALSKSSLPIILAATKCETPESHRQLDTYGVAKTFPECVGDFRTSSNLPGSARECMQAMARAAVANRRGELRREDTTGSRRRAASTANLDGPPDLLNGQFSAQQSAKHNRASSDLSLLRGFLPPSSDGSYHRGPGSRSPRLEYQSQAPQSNLNLSADALDDGASRTVSSMLRTPGIRLDGGPQDTFLDVDESDVDSRRFSEDIPILQRNDETLEQRPQRMTGVSFSELVDRLLAPRMSRADNNFADIFLCLYRKLAAPSELLAAIMSRLDQLGSDETIHYLTQTEAQMRIVELVAKWVASYPGDFARPTTRRSLEELIRKLASEPVFAAASYQMWSCMEHRVMEDDDTGWAKSDERDVESDRLSRASKEGGGDVTGTMGGLHLEEPDVHPGQRRPSVASDVSGSELGSDRVPARFHYHSFEDYEREAATMVPRANLPLNKFRYHIFMDIDSDDIADEITRIDWVMFSSIRIRDLVRDVSLPQGEKEKCRSLKNISRMTSHFNHVAKWVANMILIRDKPKHRAPCLEKFMIIAHKLRQLNNYNGLAAVMAGINGSAIHRLGATRALVNPDVAKRFAKYELLLSTQKSHFAYRLAWENSSLPRIPFMPLHRRDLVSAEEGGRTLVGPNGDRINWKKFEVLGEVLLPIMKSQGQPYPNLNKHEVSRELILDCRMMVDEEDIYQRSVAVESTSSAAADTGRKKFPWMSK